MSTVRYRLATPPDRGAIAALLETEGLPTADLEAGGVVMMVAESEQRCIGCIGIQPLSRRGIIRSLAVTPERRGAGIGRALVSRAEALASCGGLDNLYLLTEGARDFWVNAGYTIVPRAEAPPEIRDSAQFRSLCPATAACLRRDLQAPTAVDPRSVPR